MSPTSFAVSKVWSSVAVILASLYGILSLRNNGYWALTPVFFSLLGLAAVHSVTLRRDYVREPVTQPEIDLSVANERREMLAELVRHLESSAHRTLSCGAGCPVPDLVTKIGSVASPS